MSLEGTSKTKSAQEAIKCSEKAQTIYNLFGIKDGAKAMDNNIALMKDNLAKQLFDMSVAASHSENMRFGYECNLEHLAQLHWIR